MRSSRELMLFVGVVSLMWMGCSGENTGSETGQEDAGDGGSGGSKDSAPTQTDGTVGATDAGTDAAQGTDAAGDATVQDAADAGETTDAGGDTSEDASGDSSDGGADDADAGTDSGKDAPSDAGTDADAAAATYAITGHVDGLKGAGLVLSVAGESLPINVGDGGSVGFAFTTKLATGTSYVVSVTASPTNPSQRCDVSNGAGTVGAADVANVVVTCASIDFAIGGKVVALTGSGLVLRDNGADNLAVPAPVGGGPAFFTFGGRVASGTGFDVSVFTQPTSPSQLCSVTGGSGTVASGDVSTVVVNCAANTFTVGGAVSGLVGAGLKLKDDGNDEISVNGNGTFSFSTPLGTGSPYAVSVSAQPTNPWQTCMVTAGSGTIASANISNVSVGCVTNAYVVGGNASGITHSGLLLAMNGAGVIPVNANGAFSFTAMASGSSYDVTVAQNPSGETCHVTSGQGVVAGAAVLNVGVACALNTYTVGGNVSGLVGAGLKLKDNGGDEITVGANGSFTFPLPITSGGSYAVTVSGSPTGPTQVCNVTSGAGTVTTANVTDVSVVCTTSAFTVSANVSGLAGSGLTLRNNAGDDLPIGGNGTSAFSTKIPSGSGYDVTVFAQPFSPFQTCIVPSPTGTIGAANVVVGVSCTTNVYSVGGTVTNLHAKGLVLKDGAVSQTVDASGPFSFNDASGTSYAVSVGNDPLCQVSNGSGTVQNQNIPNVFVFCNDGTLAGLNSTTDSGSVVANLDAIFLRSVNVLSAMKAVSIGANFTATGNVSFAIYADAAGVPGALIAQSGSLVASGLTELHFSAPIPLAVGTYWIAVAGAAGYAIGAGPTSSTVRVKAHTVGTPLPDPLGSSVLQTHDEMEAFIRMAP